MRECLRSKLEKKLENFILQKISLKVLPDWYIENLTILPKISPSRIQKKLSRCSRFLYENSILSENSIFRIMNVWACKIEICLTCWNNLPKFRNIFARVAKNIIFFQNHIFQGKVPLKTKKTDCLLNIPAGTILTKFFDTF